METTISVLYLFITTFVVMSLNLVRGLDFGVDVLAQRVKDTECPWLMSNVIDNETQRPLVLT